MSSTITTHTTNPTPPLPPPTIELDSLPYVDNIHPDYEAYAITLIEEEMQKLPPPPPTDHSLDDRVHSNGIPLSFLNSNNNDNHNQINETEYKALLERNGAPRPNPIDYHQTTTTTTTNPSPPTTLSEWQTQLQQSKTKLQHQLHRLLQTELQTNYETSLWQQHTTTTLPNQYLQPIQNQLEQEKRRVDEINAERKRVQEEDGGIKLSLLEEKWAVGMRRMEGLKRGIGEGRREVERLRGLVELDDSK